MRIIVLERELPGATAADFHLYAQAEAARMWELYQNGVIREMYFRADRNEAVLGLECTNTEQAHAELQTLPFVQHGLIAFDVIPLKPYPGFAQLFAKEN
jgi:hypothetical protein